MAAVAFSQVGVRRGGREVLAGLDWRLEPGEMQVIFGPTGSGKTTLLALAALALGADAGEVQVFDAPAPALASDEAATLRRRIGLAAQRPEFLDHLDLAENVALPLRLSARPPAARRAQAEELLDWLGLADRAGDAPSTLSEGERRRAGLARAVIASPETILADEPGESMDQEGAARALEMLAALAAHGAAVAVATGDMELVRLARHHSEARVIHLSAGRLAWSAA